MNRIDVLICVDCGGMFPELHEDAHGWSVLHCTECNQPDRECECPQSSNCFLSVILHGVLWT